MVDVLDRLYTRIVSRNAFLDKIRFYSALRFITRILANVILPIYFYFTRNNKAYSLCPVQHKNNRLIVSLTTFPARINRLHLVIETLLRQTHKPDMIILWLSKEQFPSLDVLPKPLLAQQRRGLQIELCEGDIRSHKKYYYTLMQYPEDVLITADDDIFYRADWLEILVQYKQNHPTAVIVNYAHRIKHTVDKVEKYIDWDINITEESTEPNLFFGSGGGALFHPHALCNEVLNKEVFWTICRNADDVWLNTMVRLNNTPIVKTKYHSQVLPVLNKNNKTLAASNMEIGNDIQIDAVRQYCVAKFNKDPFRL